MLWGRIGSLLLISMFALEFGVTQLSSHDTQYRWSGRVQLAAGGNPAVCKANYDQCVKGCDGMASCTNQCAANYRGCLGQ